MRKIQIYKLLYNLWLILASPPGGTFRVLKVWQENSPSLLSVYTVWQENQKCVVGESNVLLSHRSCLSFLLQAGLTDLIVIEARNS